MSCKPICRSSSGKGFTLLEVLVASGMFLLLLGILFAVYHYATSAMLKGTAQSGQLQDLHVLSRRFRRAVQLAPVVSCTLAADGSGLSLLSAEDEQGKFQYDAALSQGRWQEYLIFYLDPAQGQIRLRKVSVLGTSQEAVAGPIESFPPADPVESYFHGGQPVLNHVESALFTQLSPSTIKLEVAVSSRRALSQAPEKTTMQIVSSFRN